MQVARVAARPFQPVGTASRRGAVVVRASAVAAPAKVPVKAADGSDKGTAELALKVAGDATANAVVHRYSVLVLQNARRVRIYLRLGGR